MSAHCFLVKIMWRFWCVPVVFTSSLVVVLMCACCFYFKSCGSSDVCLLFLLQVLWQFWCVPVVFTSSPVAVLMCACCFYFKSCGGSDVCLLFLLQVLWQFWCVPVVFTSSLVVVLMSVYYFQLKSFWLKDGHIRKILTKMVNPRDITGKAEEGRRTWNLLAVLMSVRWFHWKLCGGSDVCPLVLLQG